MKKQLLICSAILAGLSTFSQSAGAKVKSSGIDKISDKFAMDANEEISSPKLNIKPSENVNYNEAKDAGVYNISATSISWKVIAGSMNVYGQLVSQSRPLQYNDNVNAVCYIHRKSASYTSFPVSNPGTIVAEISGNWGATWDSTCIWANATNTGRYPQGGIYNPVGNTNLANAYIIGVGPTNTGGAAPWTGNFYSSRQINVANFTNTVSAVANAAQHLPTNSTTYPANQMPGAFSRNGFSSTDDGLVRSLATIWNDNGALTGFRGAMIVKGSFNAGVFNWTTDSIIPPALLTTAGAKVIWSTPQMAWNESGTTGYMMFLGVLGTATLSNKGYQPIVYKTTNSGSTWALINGIDFNSVAMAPIKVPLAAANNGTLEVPTFGLVEGFDCVVDANNKLHIASTITGAASTHQDSLSYYYTFTTSINPSDSYRWAHTPGNRPYLYDFIGDGTGAWNYVKVDSISSESPASAATGASNAENPWDPTGGSSAKIDIYQRIQLGRTPDGKYITYSWSESDSNVTNGTKKWNNLPNIKTRCMALNSGTNTYVVSSNEINVSKVAVGQGTNNANVANRATLHYMSPTTSAALISNGASTHTADVKVPFTVTNSNPYSQLTNNTSYYSSNTLSFAFTGNAVTGIKNNLANSDMAGIIYPNPTKENATLAINVKENTSVTVSIYNLVGALVKTITANAVIGSNTINLDLTNLNSGIYLANVKVGNTVSTKKLIIE